MKTLNLKSILTSSVEVKIWCVEIVFNLKTSVMFVFRNITRFKKGFCQSVKCKQFRWSNLIFVKSPSLKCVVLFFVFIDSVIWQHSFSNHKFSYDTEFNQFKCKLEVFTIVVKIKKCAEFKISKRGLTSKSFWFKSRT